MACAAHAGALAAAACCSRMWWRRHQQPSCGLAMATWPSRVRRSRSAKGSLAGCAPCDAWWARLGSAAVLRVGPMRAQPGAASPWLRRQSCYMRRPAPRRRVRGRDCPILRQGGAGGGAAGGLPDGAAGGGGGGGCRRWVLRLAASPGQAQGWGAWGWAGLAAAAASSGAGGKGAHAQAGWGAEATQGKRRLLPAHRHCALLANCTQQATRCRRAAARSWLPLRRTGPQT